MHIQRGVLQLLMTHQKLERGQIGPTLNEVGRESMPERTRAEAFRQSSATRALHAGVPDSLVRNRSLFACRDLVSKKGLKPLIRASVLKRARLLYAA